MADLDWDGATPPLDAFLEAEKTDRQLWWRIGCGHHQNLLDEAVERLERAEAAIAAVRELIREAETRDQDGWPAVDTASLRCALDAPPTAGLPGDGERAMPDPPKPAQSDPARWLAPPGPGDFECCASGSCEVCRR